MNNEHIKNAGATNACVLGMLILFASTVLNAQEDSNAEDTGAASEASNEIVLVEIPMPNLDELKPEVRVLIEPAINYFEKHRGDREGSALGLLYGRLGLHFQAHTMLDAAHAAYRNAVLLDPQNYRWSYLLAVNFQEMGNDQRAVALYAVSLGLEPANLAARTRLGLLLVKLEHLDEAEAHLQQVLKNNNRDAAALAGLGLIAFEREQYQRAISYYIRSLGSQPEAGQTHYQIALAYRALGDIENAQAHLEQHTQRIPVIEDRLLTLMNAHRVSASQYADAGSALMKSGKYQEAVKMFEFSTAINPEYLPSFVALAQGNRYLKNDEQAYAVIDDVLENDPGDPFANYIKASWLDQDGRLRESLEFYRAALAALPDYTQARMLMANVLMHLGDYTGAIEQYREIIAKNEEHMTAKFLLAVAVLADNGDCAEAMQLVDQALSADSRSARALSVQARIYATCPVASMTQKRRALDVAQALYDAQPIAETAVTLAMALAANGDYGEAADYQAQAIFEALRDQNEDRRVALAENMDRYQKQQSAIRAWSTVDALFEAPRNIRQDPVPLAANVESPQ